MHEKKYDIELIKIKNESLNNQIIRLYKENINNKRIYYCVLDIQNKIEIIEFKENPIKLKNNKRDWSKIKACFDEIYYEEFDILIDAGLDFVDIITESSVSYPYGATQKRNGNIYFNICNLKNRIQNEIIKESKKGSFPLIEYYLKNLFQDGYQQFLNFIAYRYKNPTQLIDFSFVLVGKMQIGKSFFTEEFLPRIFGEKNISNTFLMNFEALTFNSNIREKMFVNFNEFHFDNIKIIDYFKDLIKSKNQEVHKKGKEKEVVPNFSTLIFTQNNFPEYLQNMEDSRRFIVRNLKEKLFKEGSNIDDFINEIPFFIDAIKNIDAFKPEYEDFNNCNNIKEFDIDKKRAEEIEAIKIVIKDKINNNKDIIKNENNQIIIGVLKEDLINMHKYYEWLSGDEIIKNHTNFANFKKLRRYLFNLKLDNIELENNKYTGFANSLKIDNEFLK